MPASRAELHAEIDTAWSELDTFLAEVVEATAAAKDANGWSVKDHVSHMAIWGDSVAVLFRGGYRHEALGISEDLYSKASLDEVNEIIRQREGRIALSHAIRLLRDMHGVLMRGVESLPDADLGRTVRDVFPLAPRADDRCVADFIHENTAAHYSEHLPWMRKLVKGPA